MLGRVKRIWGMRMLLCCMGKGLVLCRHMYISVLDMHKTVHTALSHSTFKPEIQYVFNMNYERVHLILS
jgi:hypothetical protein